VYKTHFLISVRIYLTHLDTLNILLLLGLLVCIGIAQRASSHLIVIQLYVVYLTLRPVVVHTSAFSHHSLGLLNR
jgi:hypothetical protein